MPRGSFGDVQMTLSRTWLAWGIVGAASARNGHGLASGSGSWSIASALGRRKMRT